MEVDKSTVFSSLESKTDDLRECLKQLGLPEKHKQLLRFAIEELGEQYASPSAPPSGKVRWINLHSAMIWVTDMLRSTNCMARNFARFENSSEFCNPSSEELSECRDILAIRTIALSESRVHSFGAFGIDQKIINILENEALSGIRNGLAHQYGTAGMQWNSNGLLNQGKYMAFTHYFWLKVRLKQLQDLLEEELQHILRLMMSCMAWERKIILMKESGIGLGKEDEIDMGRQNCILSSTIIKPT